MPQTPVKKVWTEAEYLQFERSSELRHEFYNGEIFAMSGGSYPHAVLIGNLFGHLFSRLQNSQCKPFHNDLRVKIETTGLWTYPDLSIVCGPPQILDNDTLLNPTVIIEVLSPSTEHYDRGATFDHFSNISSLKSYILVDQFAPRIDRYFREAPGKWEYQAIIGLESTLEIAPIGASLQLREIYNGIQFEPNIHPLPPYSS